MEPLVADGNVYSAVEWSPEYSSVAPSKTLMVVKEQLAASLDCHGNRFVSYSVMAASFANGMSSELAAGSMLILEAQLTAPSI